MKIEWLRTWDDTLIAVKNINYLAECIFDSHPSITAFFDKGQYADLTTYSKESMYYDSESGYSGDWRFAMETDIKALCYAIGEGNYATCILDCERLFCKADRYNSPDEE